MKKIILFVFALGILTSLNFLPAEAQDTLSPDTVTIQEDQATLTFSSLGYTDDDLVSPYDMTSVRFSIPLNWRLEPGGEIILTYDVFSSGSDLALVEDGQQDYVGTLAVSFNGKKIDDISVGATGSYTTSVQIPSDVLLSAREDGRHELEILLNADVSCRYDIRTRVLMKASSYFVLPFETAPPDLDLTMLPAPFYLRDALIPEQTVLVLPDNPEAGELEAALNLSAGLGSITGFRFAFEVVTQDQLSDELRDNNHLVFVGQPSHFAQLSEIEFSLPVKDGEFVDLPVQSAEDGIIQLALSPWNESKAVLLVSGNSGNAVSKSAQAVSTGNIFVTADPTLVFVADVNSISDAIPAVEKFTLKDLGYTNQTMAEIGLNVIDYSFYLPKEQVASEDGYIDLKYLYSDLLGHDQNSSMLVSLNDETIASVNFESDSKNLADLRIEIPPGILRFGENRLRIKADLLPITDCDYDGFAKYFVTILDETTIHIPIAPTPNGTTPLALDLKMFPDVFLTHSDLDNLAFILPNDSPESWQTAAKLAFLFGREGLPLLPDMMAFYGVNVPDDVTESRSLILVGRASQFPLLLEINDALPAPFDFDNNTANEDQMQVVYRIPPDISVGYLELLPSPINPSEAILVVAGNTDDGVGLAGNILMDSKLQQQLSGLFAVTNGNQVASGMAHTPYGMVSPPEQESSIVGTAVPEAEAVTATPVVSSIQDLPAVEIVYERPSWLLPVLLVSTGVIILIVGYLLVTAIAKKRSSS